MNIKLPCTIGSIIKDNKGVEYVVCYYEIRGRGKAPLVMAVCAELLDGINDILVRVVDGSFGVDYEVIDMCEV